MLVFLGLGSNKGFSSFDCTHLLAKACLLLKEEFSDFVFSSVYITKPMYVKNQSDFYNMAVCGCTEKSPQELLSLIHQIEEKLGRNREKEIRNGPRSIDIDIEFFGNEKISYHDPYDSMKNLEIPHPKISERSFVLIPLLEIYPKNADINRREFLENSLLKTGNQGAVKFLSSSDFSKIMAESQESQNG